MGRKSRTTYFAVSGDKTKGEGWIVEGPDALNMFVRRLPSDADGCLPVVLLDRDYRVIGCDVVADSTAEARRLTPNVVLRSVTGIQAPQFVLVQVQRLLRDPSRHERYIARMIGVRASMVGVVMVDHAVVSRKHGYWSAWAVDSVDW